LAIAGSPLFHQPLFFDPVPLHLEKEIVRPQDVAICCRRFDRLAVLLMREPFGDLALQAAAQADQPLRVLREQRLVDARLVIEPFGVTGRHQLDQVVVALVRLGEQHEMVLRRARHALRSWRSPGATYTSQPRMGFNPRARAWS